MQTMRRAIVASSSSLSMQAETSCMLAAIRHETHCQVLSEPPHGDVPLGEENRVGKNQASDTSVMGRRARVHGPDDHLYGVVRKAALPRQKEGGRQPCLDDKPSLRLTTTRRTLSCESTLPASSGLTHTTCRTPTRSPEGQAI
jgi:hypothetical protein